MFSRIYEHRGVIGAASLAAATSVIAIGGAAGTVQAASSADSKKGFVVQPLPCEDGSMVQPWQAPTRASQIDRLEKEEEFDVLVIGGGCVGAGTAWEASTRGLKVAMVERSDFSAGTSGRSTKLIHGGIRYLQSAIMNFDYEMYELLEEALYERAHLMNAAPFMAKPLPIIIPIYTWWEVPYMWFGAKMYDLVAGSRRALPQSYFLTRDEALFQFPTLKEDDLKGGVVYYDGQHNDTRMNLLIALTACQAGATISNYTEVVRLIHDATGKARGAVLRDVVTGKEFTVRAKGVINATGCFGDAVRKMDNPNAIPLIQGAAGVHIILPDHFSPDNMGLIVPKTSDGRVLFFLPWEGMTICGTTDSPADITMNPAAGADDVKFIVEESNRYLNREIRKTDIKAAWSGIRPLIKDPAKLGASGTAQLSRKHVVEVSDSGMVSILGGKWTTYRRMAQDAIDKYASVINFSAKPSTTLNGQLIGADREGVVFNKKYDRIPVTLRETYGMDKDVARHLARNYGTRALQIGLLAQTHPEFAERLSKKYPFIDAEVIFGVEQEFAQTAVDILARRTRIAYLDAEAAEEVLPRVIDLMAPRLGWSRTRKAEEVAAAKAFLKTMAAPNSTADSALLAKIK